MWKCRSVAAVVLGVVCSGFALASPGCGGGERMETGTTVEKAPGQDEGQKASMDAMKAMMKGGGAAKK